MTYRLTAEQIADILKRAKPTRIHRMKDDEPVKPIMVRRPAPEAPKSAPKHSGKGKVVARRAPLPTEAQEQAAVVSWWRAYAPTRGIDARLLFAIPNGAHLAGDRKMRSIQMRRLKASGLVPGVPDLLLAVPRADAHGMFAAGLCIEMKRVGEKASREQVEMIALLRQRGYEAVIAQGADQAIRDIRKYLESRR